MALKKPHLYLSSGEGLGDGVMGRKASESRRGGGQRGFAGTVRLQFSFTVQLCFSSKKKYT